MNSMGMILQMLNPSQDNILASTEGMWTMYCRRASESAQVDLHMIPHDRFAGKQSLAVRFDQIFVVANAEQALEFMT